MQRHCCRHHLCGQMYYLQCELARSTSIAEQGRHLFGLGIIIEAEGITTNACKEQASVSRRLALTALRSTLGIKHIRGHSILRGVCLHSLLRMASSSTDQSSKQHCFVLHAIWTASLGSIGHGCILAGWYLLSKAPSCLGLQLQPQRHQLHCPPVAVCASQPEVSNCWWVQEH